MSEPLPNLPASDRYLNEMKMQTFYLLKQHPELKAEAIAHHYTSLAQTALDLRECVMQRRHASPEKRAEFDNMIAFCVDRLVRQHASDLGIALEWNEPEYPWLPNVATSRPTPAPRDEEQQTVGAKTKYDPLTKTFTLSNGRSVTEAFAAAYCNGRFTTPRRAVQVMEAELLGWTDIIVNAAGIIVGHRPRAHGFEEIP